MTYCYIKVFFSTVWRNKDPEKKNPYVTKLRLMLKFLSFGLGKISGPTKILYFIHREAHWFKSRHFRPTSPPPPSLHFKVFLSKPETKLSSNHVKKYKEKVLLFLKSFKRIWWENKPWRGWTAAWLSLGHLSVSSKVGLHREDMLLHFCMLLPLEMLLSE